MKAFLFDMDGVLYDSMPGHAFAWHASMERFGIKMTESEAYQYEGMRGVETIKLICREQWKREISDEEAQRIYDVKSAVFAGLPQAHVMPGVKTVQRILKSRGKTIVVVTGSGQRTLLARLLRDFEGLVDPKLIVTSFDCKKGKPDPEPYLRGMEKAGISADEGTVIENAPLGVRAAVAAGLFTIGVNTGPLPNESLYNEGANIVLPDMFALAKLITEDKSFA